MWLSPGLQFRLSSRCSASASANYDHNVNDDQWHSNVSSAGGATHYTFARLDQTTLSMNGRVNFTASPTLSLQFYAQPFVSTGEYSKWRELADPRASTYAARYKGYDSASPGGFNVRQFNSNAVVRWEYRPASTLFFVWQQGRSGNDPTSTDFRFQRDLGGLFELHPANTFLIKASYWFNP